jgi:hypothetical protein
MHIMVVNQVVAVTAKHGLINWSGEGMAYCRNTALLVEYPELVAFAI